MLRWLFGGPITPLPPIFNLNTDVLDEVFDYLSVRDLFAVACTCKELMEIVSDYFRRTIPLMCFDARFNRITSCHTKDDIRNYSEYVQNIEISARHSLDDCKLKSKYVFRHCPPPVKVNIVGLKQNPPRKLKRILIDAKSITLYECKFTIDIAPVLRSCRNLRALNIRAPVRYGHQNIIIGANNNWLLKKYKKLEHIMILSNSKVEEMTKFLDLNPQIQFLKIYSDFLCKNFEYFMKTKTKIKTLSVMLAPCYLEVCSRLLQELYEHGFYEQLYLLDQTKIVNQEYVNFLNPLTGLVRLKMFSGEVILNYTRLINLKELHIFNDTCVENWYELGKSLVNLERIFCFRGSTEQMFLMFKIAKKLKSYRIQSIIGSSYYSEKTRILNLDAMESARSQLRRSTNVTIYMNELDYLPTKSYYAERDFKRIRIKRGCVVLEGDV